MFQLRQREAKDYHSMNSVTHERGVVFWRDRQGYRNVMIDWQFQQHMTIRKPNYPVPAIVYPVEINEYRVTMFVQARGGFKFVIKLWSIFD
jgi:hypothetical protein